MLWVKAFHVIFIVCWFAGLFYLPRLFVYHAQVTDQISDDRFKIMERKLFWGIMTPCGILSLLTGLWLLHDYAWEIYKQAGWLHLKLSLIVLLIIHHILCGVYWLRFKQGRNKHGHVFYRVFNEVPVLFLIAIVCAVVVKPF